MGIVYMSPERMWDTWIYRAGDEFHLFFLSGGDGTICHRSRTWPPPGTGTKRG
jgi:hypothetical protein